MQERLTAEIANRFKEQDPGMSLSQLVEQIGQAIDCDSEAALLALRGYVANYAQHREAGGNPLSFYEKELLPRPESHEIFTQRFLELSGHPPQEIARILAHEFGMIISLSELQGKARYQPLERIVKDAVRGYNAQIEAFRKGDTRAVHERYARGAAAMGLEQAVYKDAVREHVLASEQQYLTRHSGESRVEGYAQPALESLQRFDRSLLRSYDGFSSEVANLYQHSDLTVQEIAEHVEAKYGMRISTSYVSEMARKHINKEREAEGKEKVSNRQEAKGSSQRKEQSAE